MISHQLLKNPSSLGSRLPPAALRLTAEEWTMIVGALSAYQHNQSYRPLYEKLVAQTS